MNLQSILLEFSVKLVGSPVWFYVNSSITLLQYMKSLQIVGFSVDFPSFWHETNRISAILRFEGLQFVIMWEKARQSVVWGNAFWDGFACKLSNDSRE